MWECLFDLRGEEEVCSTVSLCKYQSAISYCPVSESLCEGKEKNISVLMLEFCFINYALSEAFS